MSTLKELMAAAAEVNREFARPWDGRARMINAIEELGELANSVMVAEGYKDPRRGKVGVPVALAGVLYEVLNLANHYQVDLEAIFKQELEGWRQIARELKTN